MLRPRRLLCAAALIALALLVFSLPGLLHREPGSAPGTEATQRRLLRIWLVQGEDHRIPGGAAQWLQSQLRVWEKQHPGVLTYLRTVSPQEALREDAILPDVMLYAPGTLTDPQALFMPLTGTLNAREALLRCGRWQGRQYGLPLCWGAWVMTIDGALTPGESATPAPKALLGKPSATAVPRAAEPEYPLAAASQAACALQSPGGAALFSLALLLPQRPPLPEDFASLTAAEVYRLFRSQQCATAMLTSGQVTALEGLAAAGKGPAFRVMAPEEIVTDLILLGSVTPDAPAEAALLLAHLVSRPAQEALSAQSLHTVRDDLTLYAAGDSAAIERSGVRSLSAINAYLPPQQVQQAAWQAFQGTLSFTEALLPLM